MKNKYTTIGIILTTVILAGIAIFTALRLYQTRDVAVAPNVPSSKPKAQEIVNTCNLSFSLTVTPTQPPTAPPTVPPIVTAPPTVTPTPTPTASPNPQCNNSCTSNSQCPSGLMCYIASGQTAGNCRNTQCLSETDCNCAVAISTTVATIKPTTQPTLPVVGTTWPTLLGTGFGILVVIGSLLLAL